LKKIGYDAETKGKLFWKQNKLDGFYIFKDVRMEGVDNKVDLYFKVDQKSRRAKDESIIYMLIGRGETFISSTSDEAAYNAAKKFLNGFIDQSAAYKLSLDIKAQEDEVKDAEKKLNRLQDDEKSLEKKIDQLQKDLKKNREDQEDQQKKLEQERQKLQELRAKQ
jgi:predicted RNase H-like nuclease (RuvC/YqgF family)